MGCGFCIKFRFAFLALVDDIILSVTRMSILLSRQIVNWPVHGGPEITYK